MDDLDELNHQSDSIDEQEVFDRYFPPNSPNQAIVGSQINWKFLGYTSLLFAVLSNPWIDQLIEKIPYLDNQAAIFTFKFVMFLIIFFIVYRRML